MVLLEVSVAVVIVLIFTTLLVREKYTYWKRKNVPFYPPSFPFGNLENPKRRTQNVAVGLQTLYEKFKNSGVNHAGLYDFIYPVYFPISSEAIKNVMQSDFQYFVNRGMYYNEKDDPLSAHLFALGGHKWRMLRTKLTPTFTSGKIKSMFSTLIKCTQPMQETMSSLCDNNQPAMIKDIVARFTTDIIGSCAFGLECDSFKSKNTAFRYYGQKIIEAIEVNRVKRALSFASPKWARKLGITILPQDSAKFLLSVIKDTVEYRRENNIQRKDMLQILMELQKNSTEDANSKLTIEEIAAQAFIFFLAGFETSSMTMSLCLYELARNIEIQNKVREEINRVLNKSNGDITYEAITDMKYMNQVVEETLRLYPPLPTITRQCVKDYHIPGTDIIIETGTRVFIPVLALQRDPLNFKDPGNFNPERFSEENKVNIRPFTYIPFGEGPRVCIGARFGMMQTKVGLTNLLKNYSFSVNYKTGPLVIDKHAVIINTENEILLDLQRVNTIVQKVE